MCSPPPPPELLWGRANCALFPVHPAVPRPPRGRHCPAPTRRGRTPRLPNIHPHRAQPPNTSNQLAYKSARATRCTSARSAAWVLRRSLYPEADAKTIAASSAPWSNVLALQPLQLTDIELTKFRLANRLDEPVPRPRAWADRHDVEFLSGTVVLVADDRRANADDRGADGQLRCLL